MTEINGSSIIISTLEEIWHSPVLNSKSPTIFWESYYLLIYIKIAGLLLRTVDCLYDEST